MKKNIILIIALLASATTLYSQEVEVVELIETQTSEKHLYWSIGVTGGLDRNYHIVDMSYMSDYHYSKYAEGNSYGLQLGFSPTNWLKLRVDGVMLQKNYNRSHVIGNTNTSMPDTTFNQYLNIPVVLQFTVGKVVQLHAFGGGYWGRWLKSRRKGLSYGMNGLEPYDEEVDFNSPESQVRDNRTDIGLVWGGGVGTVIKKRIEIGVEIRWYYGIYDIQNDYMAHINPRYNTTVVLQGGINYRF